MQAAGFRAFREDKEPAAARFLKNGCNTIQVCEGFKKVVILMESDKNISEKKDAAGVNSDKKSRPIGFMDSGVGGLSVLKEAVRILPNEDFIYYGDSKNAPYGNKSKQEIKRLTFEAVEHLRQKNVKALVVACNTATAAAIRALRLKYNDIPIIGIEPAVKPAVICSRGGRIIVMATAMTVRQPRFKKLIDTYKDEADIVPLACEGLMEFVEYGNFDSNILNGYLQKNLWPLLSENTESIVLGCTHYPFLIPQIREFLGSRDIMLIDGSKGTSSQLKRRLKEEGLLREGNCKGRITIENSSENPFMTELSERLLNMEID